MAIVLAAASRARRSQRRRPIHHRGASPIASALPQRESERLAGEARTLVGDLRTLEIERDLKNEQAKQAAAQTAEAEQGCADDRSTRQPRAAAAGPAARHEAAARGRLQTRTEWIRAPAVRRARRARVRARCTGHFGLASLNQKRAEEHRRTLEALQAERAAFAQRARDLQAQEAVARQARAEAERAVAARTAKMSEIDSRRDLTAQYMGELQVAYDKIQLQDSVPAEGRRTPSGSTASLSRRARLADHGPDRQPVRTGRRPTWGQRGQKRRRDRLDGGPAGPGGSRRTVAYADAFTGLGTLVILDHGGNNYSLYGYLGSVTVQTGGQVETGSEIGRVGASPWAAGALFRAQDRRETDRSVQWLKPR